MTAFVLIVSAILCCVWASYELAVAWSLKSSDKPERESFSVERIEIHLGRKTSIAWHWIIVAGKLWNEWVESVHKKWRRK